MLIWSASLLILTAAAAYFGFSAAYAPYTDLAQILFFLFLSLFLLSVAVAIVTGGQRGGPALRGPARSVGLLVLVSAMAAGVYSWISNDLTAERVGRAIDRRTASASANAGRLLRQASQSTSDLFAGEPSDAPSSGDGNEHRSKEESN